MKIFRFVICLLFLCFFAIQTANAHAFLTNSFPTAKSQVDQLPNLVWVEFDGNLQTFENMQVNKLQAFDSKGNRLDDGNYKVGGARVAVKIIKQAFGEITFRYRVVSEDGHPVEGEFNIFSNFKDQEPLATPSKETENQTEVTKVTRASPKQSSVELPATNLNKIDDESLGNSHSDSFVEHHSVHIIEFLISLAGIALWFIYKRIK